jgi:putative ABC transport system permease protein
MAELRDDLRFAVRVLRKSPGFTAVALLTLALAIGANTAIFSVVNGVLLRPLPFPEPERLYSVVRRAPNGYTSALSVPQYAFLLEQEQPFSQLAAYPVLSTGFNLSDAQPPLRVQGAQVTRSFFEVFGLQPALGRGFLPEEDIPGGQLVVVLGHELWQRHFGGRPDVLGQSLTLSGEPYIVVGVAPPGFRHPENAQLWTPLRLDLSSAENYHHLMVVGRQRDDVDPEQVGAMVGQQGEQLRVLSPDILRPTLVLGAVQLHTLLALSVRPALLVLLGAVALLLLISCVNLANLQLARAVGRERELALRTALGASPGRIARQLLTESLLLSGVGGVLGLLLAAGLLPGLLALAPEQLPLRTEIRMDGAVLAFTFSVSVFAGCVFGMLPAWQVSKLEPRSALQVSSLSATIGVTGNRMRLGLVVGQVALSIILLIGAGLLLKSFAVLRGVSPGFDPEGVLTMKISMPESRYGSIETFDDFVQRLLERERALPGIEAVGLSLVLPFESGPGVDFTIHGRSRDKGSVGRGEGHYRPVTGGYFKALKLEAVRGRLLDDQDRHGTERVAVINEVMARRYWLGQDPIGHFVTLGASTALLADPKPREIIGVVSDVREQGLHEEPSAVIYLPMGQVPERVHARFMGVFSQNLLVRTKVDLGSLEGAVKREIWALDPQLPIIDVVSLEAFVERSLGPRRFNTLLMSLMAGMALVLAAMGIYGVLSYLVNLRKRELGVRMALGATRGQVVLLVLRQGLATVGAGMALGLVGAFWLTRLLSHMLVYVSSLDPLAFFLAAGLLFGVALVAIAVPAVRASRVDPMVSLRTE